MKVLLDRPKLRAAGSGMNVNVMSKASVCASVLAEARRLADRGTFGPLLNQLLARACELLDDLDEILVALDPARNVSEFTTAAELHRHLEQVQALVPARWRARVAPPPYVHPR